MTYGKYLLRQKGVAQKDVAKWLQINPATLSLVLSGREDPSARVRERLETFFGLPLETIVSAYEEEEHDFTTR
jgi:transcriptional regulator with XRE-family HTH domain